MVGVEMRVQVESSLTPPRPSQHTRDSCARWRHSRWAPGLAGADPRRTHQCQLGQRLAGAQHSLLARVCIAGDMGGEQRRRCSCMGCPRAIRAAGADMRDHCARLGDVGATPTVEGLHLAMLSLPPSCRRRRERLGGGRVRCGRTRAGDVHPGRAAQQAGVGAHTAPAPANEFVQDSSHGVCTMPAACGRSTGWRGPLGRLASASHPSRRPPRPPFPAHATTTCMQPYVSACTCMRMHRALAVMRIMRHAAGARARAPAGTGRWPSAAASGEDARHMLIRGHSPPTPFPRPPRPHPFPRHAACGRCTGGPSGQGGGLMRVRPQHPFPLPPPHPPTPHTHTHARMHPQSMSPYVSIYITDRASVGRPLNARRAGS